MGWKISIPKICVTMAHLAFTSRRAQLIPVCTDEVKTHRLTKSQSHFHLRRNNTFMLWNNRATADPPWCCKQYSLINTCVLRIPPTANTCGATILWLSAPFINLFFPPVIAAHLACVRLSKRNLPSDIWGRAVNECMVSNTFCPDNQPLDFVFMPPKARCLSAKTAV